MFKKILSKKSYLVLITVVLVFISVIGIALAYFLKPQTVVKKGHSTWEISVVYDRANDGLELKNLTLLDRTITVDSRDAQLSPYTISVVSNDSKVLYEEKVNITEEISFNLLVEPLKEGEDLFIPSQADDVENLLFVPYFDNSKEIVIKKDRAVKLTVQLPNEKGVSVSGQIADVTCNPLVAVFVSDGYSDFNKFHQDAETLIQAFSQTEPYSSKDPSIFQYEILENSQEFGCKTSIMQCIQTKKNAIIQRVVQDFPNASRVIVLVDRPIYSPQDGSVAGVNSTPVSIFPNASDGVGRQYFQQIAVHEFLGHSVGRLNDRYVLRGTGSGIQQSNCSSQPSGQVFWDAAANGQPLQISAGCYAQNLYAPYPATCPGNSSIESGGRPDTAMSAVGCGGNNFDAVERYWIQNQILSAYSVCSDPTVTPIPTDIPTPTEEPPPTEAPTPTDTTSICNPDGSGTEGEIEFGDLRLIRQELASVTTTNNGSCLTDPSSDQTGFPDLRRARRIISGLEPL